MIEKNIKRGAATWFVWLHLFYFIGNTVIHSCVKVELSYEIKNAPRGAHCGGKEECRCRDPPQAENPASRILFHQNRENEPSSVCLFTNSIKYCAAFVRTAFLW